MMKARALLTDTTPSPASAVLDAARAIAAARDAVGGALLLSKLLLLDVAASAPVTAAAPTAAARGAGGGGSTGDRDRYYGNGGSIGGMRPSELPHLRADQLRTLSDIPFAPALDATARARPPMRFTLGAAASPAAAAFAQDGDDAPTDDSDVAPDEDPSAPVVVFRPPRACGLWRDRASCWTQLPLLPPSLNEARVSDGENGSRVESKDGVFFRKQNEHRRFHHSLGAIERGPDLPASARR